ncbi:MAG TPA: phosphoglucosamine mutase, partial [Pyrinomonadaceae bacterium]|nr:phosphoglucosamine mutase [Pyrinomonadaceae bacterium]
MKLFGTDGIRAKAGEFPLDTATARIIGASLAQHLAERNDGRKPRIVIGRDTRESGPAIEAALTEGALAVGATVESAGVITTPGVAFLTRSLHADAGVVISASHNPFDDNGIKIFDPSGRKLDDATERKIESDIAAGSIDFAPDGFASPNQELSNRLRETYLDYLKTEVARGLSLGGLKMVVDCANGAASGLAPRLFAGLGAMVIPINCDPDGRNI